MSLRKVSKDCQDLVARGLLDRREARRIPLVTALTPTLGGPECSVSMEELARAVGTTMPEINKEVETLRLLGFAVDSVKAGALRLTKPFDDLLVAEAVLAMLLERHSLANTPSLGLPYRYQESCGSTNQSLKAAAGVLPTGTLMVTDDQTEGKGRSGRTWWSEPGRDLTFSALLRPSLSAEEAPLLSLAAALAVAEMLEGLTGLQGRVRVKWPNDVLVGDRKVCGILLESSLSGAELEWVVAGVGLNVNSDPATHLAGLEPSEKRAWAGKPTPSSLLVETGHEVARGRLLADLIPHLSPIVANIRTPDFLSRLRARDALLGRRVRVFAGPPDGALLVAGTAVGLGSKGELLVRGERGETASMVAGEVTLSVDS